jgi:hypothetical protein
VPNKQRPRGWRVKAIRDLRQQWRSLRQSDVERLVCTDLVDFRDLAANLAVPFAFRDQFRGRSWARAVSGSGLGGGADALAD